MDACHLFQVYMKISVPKGIQFVGHPGKRHLTKKMCVASGETEPMWVVLSFGDLGLSNITGEIQVLIGASPLSRTPRDPGAESRHGGRVSRTEQVVEGQESYWRSLDQSRVTKRWGATSGGSQALKVPHQCSMHLHLHTCALMHIYAFTYMQHASCTQICVHAYLGSLGQEWGTEERQMGSCFENQHRVLKSPQPKLWLTEKRAAAAMGSPSDPQRRITLTEGSPLEETTSGAV